ncbi:methionine ABC transporter ATP-binding protein [Aquabacterium sp.]|uniref:methionine ABC transporter ATP-binding protein n=1 Tax=Aquabacterium sp. TaxID=1872578 RepID=UPI0035C67C54
MIALERLHKTYPARGGARHAAVTALDDVSLHVQPGEIFGVIGRSGAGKSTLIRTVNLLERPDQGVVRVGGVDLTALSPRELQQQRQRIGMVFQHFNLLQSRTVAGNVRYPMQLAGGRTAAEMDRRVDELLTLVGLAHLKDRHPSQLSGGQKQRVGIARALANEPHVLLCDEATSALDPETTEQILSLLADVSARLKLTVLLITHEMHVIHSLCDRVAVMEQGRIVEQGRVLDVFLDPQHATTRSLLAHAGFLLDEGAATEPGRPHLQITAVGAAAQSPLLDRLREQHGIRLNLLEGRVTHIKGEPVARLRADVLGADVPLDRIPALVAELGGHARWLNEGITQ